MIYLTFIQNFMVVLFILLLLLMMIFFGCIVATVTILVVVFALIIAFVLFDVIIVIVTVCCLFVGYMNRIYTPRAMNVLRETQAFFYLPCWVVLLRPHRIGDKRNSRGEKIARFFCINK